MTANIETLAGGLGDHIRYDENGYQANLGLNPPTTTIWLGQQTLNTTTNTDLDGVDFYVIDSAGATVDVMYYSSIAAGIPSGLLYSQSGYAATPGWNRLKFDTPQSFPAGAERGIVVKVVNNVSTRTIPVDYLGAQSGRSYYDSDGVGTFSSLGFDLNLVALVGDNSIAPTATIITPATNGPTNSDSVSFNVTFSEDVVNFNNANDIIISHNGTASSGLNFAGSGSNYTVTVTGITGNGNFTLKVNTGSDVEDASGNALGSSVTSTPVSIDNAAPTETDVTPATTGPTNADSVSFDITFNETVINFNDANDVSIGHEGTANSGLSISGSGVSYSVTVTGITGNGSLVLKTNINSDVTDTAGNALVTTISSPVVTIDNANPSAQSISSLSSSPTNADSVSFDMTFSEDVVNFNNASDVIISHSGTASSGLNFVGSGSSYTVTVTGITGDGSFTLEANTGSDVEDAAGNALSSSVTSEVVSIDNMAPVVTIGAPSAASTQTGPVSYTITYGDADEITLSNGNVTLNRTDTADGVVNVTGAGTSTRMVTISGISGQGTLGISLDAGTASDTAGNSAGAAGPGATFSVIVSEEIFEDSFESP